MLGTIIGAVVGILATAIVAHYYFRRSRLKSLAPFTLLESNVFSGLDPEDRKKLRVEYLEKEIVELHELEFLVGNDGELAISNCIEPLTLTLPQGAEVLDASILHRSPSNLQVSATAEGLESPAVRFDFPLLNKGDYFVVKLLLAGRARARDCKFTLLAEDLPRELKPRRFDTDDLRSMSAIVTTAAFLTIGSVLGSVLYLLFLREPTLFPFRSGFHPSVFSLVVVPLGLLIACASLLVVFMMIIVFLLHPLVGDRLPFKLPEEIASRGFEFTFANMKRLKSYRGHFIMPIEDPEEGSDKI